MAKLVTVEFDDPELTPPLLEELANELRSEGVDVTVLGPRGPRRVPLRKTADAQPVVEVLLIVLEDLREVAIGAAAYAIARWGKRHGPFRRRRGARPTAVIWGPDEEVLKKVELPYEEDDSGEDRDHASSAP